MAKQTTVASMLLKAFELFAARRCLGERVKQPDGSFAKEFRWLTFDQVRERVLNLLGGLQGVLGVKQHEALSICSYNAISWFVADWASAIGGVVTAPIHHGLPLHPLPHPKRASKQRTRVALRTVYDRANAVHVINSANVVVVVCSRSTTNDFLALLADKACPSLRAVLQMEPLAPEQKGREGLYDMAALEAYGKQHPPTLPVVVPEDLHTIVFTSGSTGKPKGIPFTHGQSCHEAHVHASRADPIVDISVSACPSTHKHHHKPSANINKNRFVGTRIGPGERGRGDGSWRTSGDVLVRGEPV